MPKIRVMEFCGHSTDLSGKRQEKCVNRMNHSTKFVPNFTLYTMVSDIPLASYRYPHVTYTNPNPEAGHVHHPLDASLRPQPVRNDRPFKTQLMLYIDVKG